MSMVGWCLGVIVFGLVHENVVSSKWMVEWNADFADRADFTSSVALLVSLVSRIGLEHNPRQSVKLLRQSLRSCRDTSRSESEGLPSLPAFRPPLSDAAPSREAMSRRDGTEDCLKLH